MLDKDIAKVSKIMCVCYKWLAKENNYTDQQIAYLLSERGSIGTIQAEAQSQLYFVAEMDGHIVGMAAVKGNEIGKLFIDPDYHRQGIGTMLFDSAQRAIIETGYEEMIVGVMAPSAVGFYEKMGMSIFDEKIPRSGAFAGYKVPLMRKVFIS